MFKVWFPDGGTIERWPDHEPTNLISRLGPARQVHSWMGSNEVGPKWRKCVIENMTLKSMPCLHILLVSPFLPHSLPSPPHPVMALLYSSTPQYSPCHNTVTQHQITGEAQAAMDMKPGAKNELPPYVLCSRYFITAMESWLTLVLSSYPSSLAFCKRNVSTGSKAREHWDTLARVKLIQKCHPMLYLKTQIKIRWWSFWEISQRKGRERKGRWWER